MFKKIFFILSIFIFLISNSFSKDNVYIVVTVDEQILTNFDIKKESDYLKALNPKLVRLSKKEIFKLSKESLINEIIKKKEIEKVFSLDRENEFLNDYLRSIYSKLNFNNEKDFENYLINSANYSLDKVKQKLKIELMWNEIIYLRYNEQVKIDKEKLSKKIEGLNQEKLKEYQLSEIIFKKIKDQNINELIEKINLSISSIGFNNTANVHSISDSAKLGGKIGWIEENNLSKTISDKIKNLQEGQVTKAFKIGNNFLILKVDKIRLRNVSINKKDELNKMIKFETNKQLNQFSKIFFDKSKINYSINEK